MRSILLCAGLFALWAGPAASGPLSACDFITRAEVEKMLGEKVAPPMVTDGGICAGMCASLNNSRCDFSTAGEGKKKEFYFYVLLPPYEFSGRAERETMESDEGKNVAVQDVAGFGEGAFWYYRYDIEQSLFFIYPNRRVHFMVQEINAEPHAAFAVAAAASALGLKRFGALKKARLRNAFEFEWPGETHPWRP